MILTFPHCTLQAVWFFIQIYEFAVLMLLCIHQCHCHLKVAKRSLDILEFISYSIIAIVFGAVYDPSCILIRQRPHD
jgi:hypothetical protein